MNTPKIDAVPANPNPVTAAKSPRKSQVKPDAGITPGVPPVVRSRTPLGAAVREVIQGATATIGQQDAALASQYLTVAVAPSGHKRGPRVARTREPLIASLTDLARRFPVLVAVGVSPDAIDAEVAAVGDLRALSAALGEMKQRVDATATVRIGAAWTDAMDIYAQAGSLGRRDTTLAAAVAPIRQVLSPGRRVTTAPLTTAAAQQGVSTATRRAARAQQKADAAKFAQSLAEAQAHGTPLPAVTAPTTPAR